MARQSQATALTRLASALGVAGQGQATRSRNPFDGYGVMAIPGPARVAPRSKGAQVFDVREARKRLVDFISGTFSPASINELVDHMAKKYLSLELRLFDGRSVNYVVDIESRKAVPASAVDARLSRPGIHRMFGATPVRAVTPEEKDAQNLRARNAGRFMALEDNGTLFADWDDVSFTAPNLFGGREFTVQGAETWIGQGYARASSDPARNLAIMQRARREGVELLLPAESKERAEKGDLVPNMPIVVRDGAIRASLVHPTMHFDVLARAYRSLPHTYWRELAAKSPAHADPLGGAATVVDIERFRKRRGPTAGTPAATVAEASRTAAVPAASPVGAVAAKRVEAVGPVARPVARDVAGTRRGPPGRASREIRHELSDRGLETMVIVNPAGDDRPFDPASMPAGTYRKVDAFGLVAGSLVIEEDGSLLHLDPKGREHNEFGPSRVPPLGSGDLPRHALAGEAVTTAEFRRRTRQVASPPPMPSRAPRPVPERRQDALPASPRPR